MENNNPRVLAYTLAKTINKEMLSEISGGGSGNTFKISHHASLSGGGGNSSLDAVIDF